MNTQRFAPAILIALTLNPALWARHTRDVDTITEIKMQRDSSHPLMIAVACRIDGDSHPRKCMIDTGATHTMISDKLLVAEGPVVVVATPNGLIHAHQRQVSLTLDGRLQLESTAFVGSNMTPGGIEILLGEDVLRQFRSVIFDYENQEIEFHR
jgi:hypothetical protein